MPFLGTTPTQGFVGANPKQSFTANGSTTVFTLTNPVASANDLEVFVGNVRQEPTAAYTAAGTTLTMSEAPATGLNFYVINKSQAQVTTTPPVNSISTDKILDDAVTGAKIENNPTIAGTLAVTGNSTANSINLGGRSLGAGGTPLGVNFSSASTNGMQINDTNSGNLGGFMGFYSGSGAGTNRANIQNANNAGIHVCVGTSGSVVFTNNGYVAANALDDYEEGTWTPIITGYSGGNTQTYQYQTGNYVKVGKVVTCTYQVRLSAKGNISGTYVHLKGMPFANLSTLAGSGIIHYVWSINTSRDNLHWELGGGNTDRCWLTYLDGTTTAYSTASDITNTTGFMGTLVYYTDA